MMMVGQGPTRRSTTLKSSSSVMRKTGETLMRRELRATRSPSQLLVRNGPLKQMAERATPPAANRPLPRRPGQRPLGLQRQSRGLLSQSLPHPHLTGAPPGTGAPLGTTQIVASPQHPKTRMRHGGSGENSLRLRSPWL
uniref:Proline rich coiled-coil 2A n=1 Tax=Rousettus aegyptiacus TaxID=9407 RepID=A0A7J8KEX0_ROUAE|nr:proline rich coiled-coil 2A [Rousettus aegyptiacus]